MEFLEKKKRVGFYLRQRVSEFTRVVQSDSRFARSPSRRRKRERGGRGIWVIHRYSSSRERDSLSREDPLQRPLPLLLFLPSRFPHVISSPLPRLAPRTHKIKIPRCGSLRCPPPPPFPLSCEERERFSRASLRREFRGDARTRFSRSLNRLFPSPPPAYILTWFRFSINSWQLSIFWHTRNMPARCVRSQLYLWVFLCVHGRGGERG